MQRVLHRESRAFALSQWLSRHRGTEFMRLTYLVFALLGLFWGSNFIYMKWAAELITPAQITLLRVFFGFLPLAFVAWQKGVIHRDQLRHLPHFLVMAVLATAFYYFAIAEGTALLPSGVAGVLGGSISLFTTIATLLFLRTEKPNALMLAGVATGLCRHSPDRSTLGGLGQNHRHRRHSVDVGRHSHPRRILCLRPPLPVAPQSTTPCARDMADGTCSDRALGSH